MPFCQAGRLVKPTQGLASKLNRRVVIERPIADESLTGSEADSWAPVAEAWANVQDMLPSRGERLADGLNMATRPARVRMRFRTDITSAMRLVMGDRVMQITTVPAELGFREAIEFMVEDYSSRGGAA
jgi:SPP1 family predicted phage head-tail adaptor